MQRRLDDFFGFSQNNRQTTYNPFDTELREEPNRSEDVLDMIKKAKGSPPAPLTNVLDAPEIEGRPLPPMELFPVVKPQTPIPEQSIVPMDQPRTKDGQRLLYKWPDLPRVGVKGAYWLLVGSSDRSEAAWLLQFDGAANPNPGPASSGAVLWSPKDLDGRRTPVFEIGKYLGRATNNIAEAQGLLLGLKMAVMRGARELLIEGDSELIIFQQIRKYQVKDKNLKQWWAETQAAMMDETCFDWIAVRQVPREQNERADSITKEVLGRKEGFQRNG